VVKLRHRRFTKMTYPEVMAMAERVDPNPGTADGVLFQLTCADFRRNPDGSWITTRQINLKEPGGTQMALAADRRFERGELFLFGLDLAATLDKYCT
jgi:hypothetical protein